MLSAFFTSDSVVMMMTLLFSAPISKSQAAADTDHELPLGTEALPDARKTLRIWTQKQQGTSVSCEVHAGDN
jgi:hypothetical protein